MTHQIATRAGPNDVQSQDDWKSVNEIIEKKRAQNRLAQRNYRRNVKRRIEELEQQVAMQTQLLALEGKPSKARAQQVSPLMASTVPFSVDGNLGISSDKRQKDGNAPLLTPASQLCDTPEDSSRSDKPFDTLWYCHTQDTNDHKEVLYDNLKSQIADRFPVPTRVEEESRTNGEMRGHLSRPESPTKITDLDIAMLDEVQLHSPIDSFRFSSIQSQGRESEDRWCEFERGSSSPGLIGDKALLAVDDTTFEQTVEGRVEYMIRCARKAGFQDLDSAITTFYTAKFDEDSECSIAQYISRRRCLPNLLEELRSKSDAWKMREVQPYHNEVLKSAEGLLLGEMRSQQGAGVNKILSNLLSSDCGGSWGAISLQFQDELPHLWSLLTALIMQGNQRPQFRQQPRLVTAIVSLLFASDCRSPIELSRQVHDVLTK